MSGGHIPSAPTSTTSNGMFSGLELPTSTPQPGPSLETDLFGAMETSNPAQPVTPAAQHTPPALGDPFGGQGSQAGGDLFGGLSMGAGRQPDLMGGGQVPAAAGVAASGFTSFAGINPAGRPPLEVHP
jgi:hypothetical protein